MNTKKIFIATALIMASSVTLAATATPSDAGLYLTGSVGFARTTLDTSNTVHATTITSDSTDKIGYQVGIGYRFNTYIGTELSYVNFGKPNYQLLRGVPGPEASTLTVQNTAFVLTAIGYLPLNNDFTLTGKAGVAFVHTQVNRVGQPGNTDSYSDADDQVHPTFGLGAIYKLTSNLDLRADLDWYPKITKTNDRATDTDASMVSVGLRYKF